MKKTIASILIVAVVSFFNLASNSIAEEVVLCMSETDQYIVTVNEKGDCLEEESQIVLSGSGMQTKKSMTPVANFKPNEECDGEGTLTEIGFDENGNSQLDNSEIDTTTGTCSPAVVEDETESEELAEASKE